MVLLAENFLVLEVEGIFYFMFHLKKEIILGECFKTEKSIRNFIIKWNTVNETILNHELLRNKIDVVLLFDYWKEGLLPFNFYGNLLFELLLQQFDTENIPSALSGLYKGELKDESYTVIEVSLQYYFSNCRDIDTQNVFNSLKAFIAYLFRIASSYSKCSQQFRC